MENTTLDLSESFWDERYKMENIGWDLGEVSPPLKAYFDQLQNKNLHILIPGGGNSYEAEYLHNNGFINVFVADIASTALQNIKQRVPSFPTEHLLHINFFDLEMKFDLIIEQTFFCALNPSLRTSYAEKAHQLLNNDGRVVGLLFDIVFGNNHPPFGGSKIEYQKTFEPLFQLDIFERSYNSHPARQGSELFINMKKR